MANHAAHWWTARWIDVCTWISTLRRTINPDQISNLKRLRPPNLQGISTILNCCLNTLINIPFPSPRANNIFLLQAFFFYSILYILCMYIVYIRLTLILCFSFDQHLWVCFNVLLLYTSCIWNTLEGKKKVPKVDLNKHCMTWVSSSCFYSLYE